MVAVDVKDAKLEQAVDLGATYAVRGDADDIAASAILARRGRPRLRGDRPAVL